MRYTAYIASAIAMVLATGSTAEAQFVPQLKLKEVFGGMPVTPAILGQRVYLPTGRTIVALEYRNPAAPQVKGDTSLQPASGQIVGIAHHGRYLYAAWDTINDYGGVAIYSIQNPDQPKLVGEITNYTPSLFRDVQNIAVNGDYLYLLDSENGIFVAALDTPQLPQFQLGAQLFGSWQDVQVKGDRLYTTGREWSGGRAIEIFDIASPLAPVPLGYATINGESNFSLAFEAPMAYGFGHGFSIHDASDPANVVLLNNQFDGRVNYSGLVVADHAYAIGNTDIQPWSVVDPASPSAFPPIPMDTFATDLAVPLNGDALLVTRADRILAVDLDNPVQPNISSEVLIKGAVDASDIAFVGDTALILQSTYGLQVANPVTFEPEVQIAMDIPPELRQRIFERIHVEGTVAYLASTGSGLFMVDISDPALPRQIGHWSEDSATSIDVSDGYAIVGRVSLSGGLSVVDVSNPASPLLRGELENIHALQLDAHERKVFVADVESGMRVIDFENVESPVNIGLYDDNCTVALALALSDNGETAYLLCAYSGLHIVDVTEPAQPVRIGSLDLGGGTAVASIAIDGNRAYVGTDLGFDEIDISNPAQPTLNVRHPMPRPGRSIRIAPDGRVLVMGGTAGLHVFDSTDKLFANGFDDAL